MGESNCFSEIPVWSLNGKSQFVDPENRILKDQATNQICRNGLLPVYKTIQGPYIQLDPELRVIIAENVNMPKENTSNDAGLLPAQLVSNWFDLSYLQSFDRSFFEFFDANGPLRRALPEFNSIYETFDNLRHVNPLSFGPTINLLGTIGGVVTIIWLVIRIIRITVMTCIKGTMVHEGSLMKTLFRAFFLDIYVLTNNQRYMKPVEQQVQGGDG